MKRIIILTFMAAYVKAATDCWATDKGFNCCSDNIMPVFNDTDGFWGVEKDNWCGIKRRDYCWAKSKDYPCCSGKSKNMELVDMDGIWGLENGSWCGYKESVSRWNDREKIDKTKKDWNSFKSKWDKDYKNNFERLSVFVGEDESMLNFGWYSTTDKKPYILFGTTKDMSDAQIYNGTNVYYKTLNGKKYYSNKVTVTDIKRNSVYYYQRNLNGKLESKVQFKTYDPYNFNFIFVGDPQIGGSNSRVSILNKDRTLTIPEGTRNDAFNWNVTVINSFKKARNPSILLSTGDQVDTDCYDNTEENNIYQENQYSGFLLPELMRKIPTALTLGNHDAYTENFRHHFHTPNPYKPGYARVKNYNDYIPAYNYYFRYNNVLVVVLETNFNSCDDFSNTINEAIKKHPNTDWRIAMFHHDIYSNGKTHSNDSYIKSTLRKCLTKLFDENKFDLVLNGHDHVYSASHFIKYDSSKSSGYSYNIIKKGEVQKNPKGTLYITANCSTGSKLYTFLSEYRDYLFYYDQPYIPTFGILDFKAVNGKVQLSINTYDVETLNVVDGPYIIEKTQKCWSLPQGYPCCKNTNEVFFTDEYGSWGVENDNWCGITKNSSSKASNSSVKVTKTTARTTTTTRTNNNYNYSNNNNNNCADNYQPCGGQNYTGPTCCKSGKCVRYNEYYSQCEP